MLKIEYNINENDYMAFNEFHVLNSQVGKKALRQYSAIMPIVSILAIILFIIAKAQTGLIIVEAVVLSIGSVIWIVFSKKIFLKNIRKTIEKTKADGRLPFHEKGTLEFGDEYITDITLEGENKVSYEKVERCCVGNTAVYIYFSALEAFIVPFEAFSSEAEKENLLSFLGEKTKTIT